MRRSLFYDFYFSLRILSLVFLFCSFFFLSASYLFSSSFRFRFVNECIFSRRFEFFIFSHSRLFLVYISAFSLSLSHTFFLTCFSISFCSLFHSTWRHFYVRTPRDFFFLAIPVPCGRIFVLFYFRHLHFSFSFDAYAALCQFRAVRAVASFIVFVSRCPSCSRVAYGAAAPIPLQVFHARKRAFSYFSRLPFSRVRPTIAR